MESDILDALEDLGYNGPLLDEVALDKALEDGAKSVEYTQLVSWLSKELQTLSKLEGHVNPISTPDDATSFLLEVSTFLRETLCPHSALTDGPVSERLATKDSRMVLLDYLCSELQAARMIFLDNPDKGRVQVEMHESQMAKDLKTLLIVLGFGKPPNNITPSQLFGKVEIKLKELLAKTPHHILSRPLFTGVLTDKQWHNLDSLQREMQDAYRVRRELLLKRLDVTIQSFKWTDRLKNKENEITAAFMKRQMQLSVEPNVTLADVLAACEDLIILEKTSNANVRKNTQSKVNKVLIGAVPDRGGRPEEQQPPPPEMPSWQKRTEPSKGGFGGSGHGGDQGSNYGGRGGSSGGRGGRGDNRGGRVQGGWSGGGGSYDGASRGSRGGGRGRGGRGSGYGYSDPYGGGAHHGYQQPVFDAAGSYGYQQYHQYH